MTSVPADRHDNPSSTTTTSTAAVGDPAAAAAAAAEPAGRRGGRRRRRAPMKRRPRHLAAAAVIAVAIGIAGAVLGIGGAFGVLGYVEDDIAAQAADRQEEDFLALCQARLADIDCACLWNDAAAAFLPDTRDQVMRLIAERHSIPLRVQRTRTDHLIGPELGKQVWAAAYYCRQG